MLRHRAVALFEAVTDAGFIASVGGRIDPKMVGPDGAGGMTGEHFTVSISTIGRLDGDRIRELIEIGERYEAELHFVGGDGLTFLRRS